MTPLSDPKIAEIYAKIKVNPEILTENQAFIEQRIDASAHWLIGEIGLSRYPELVQGYSKSRAGGSTDITGLTTSEINISVDSERWYTLEVPVAGLNTGSAIAAELQVQIRDIGVDAYKFVNVTFANTIYTITSPTFGAGSSVLMAEIGDKEELAQALGLSTIYGGTEVDGGEDLPIYDDMVVRLVQHQFNEIGIEGMKSFSEQGSVTLTQHDIDPMVARFIENNRKLPV